MFATGLLVGNLNAQPMVFKCQGTFNAVTDQQETLLLVGCGRQESVYTHCCLT